MNKIDLCKGGFSELPIGDNVLCALERYAASKRADETDEGAPPVLDIASLAAFSDPHISDMLSDCVDWGDRELEEDLIFAFAYLGGVGDALDMTRGEVFDAWRAEQ